jgi:hypothetical protein
MVKNGQQKLTLDRLTEYQIIVPGHLDNDWFNDGREIIVENSSDEVGLPTTTLTGKFDQAALIGLLRRLYSLGLPLISVNCLGGKELGL